MKPLDLSGQRFGKLVAVKRHETKTSDGKWNWECRCDCGAITITSGKRLKEGTTRSCGCLRAETIHKNQDHLPKGMYRSPTHNSWRAIFDRCENSKNQAYHRYGGRGIKVCERWRKFTKFLADMGTRPHGTSLDRYPNKDGDYEPANCRWASDAEQQSNRCDNSTISFNGQTLTISEWARRLNMKTATLGQRIRTGWPTHLALTVPVSSRNKLRSIQINA